MKEAKEITECKKLFYVLGRAEKISVIRNSNLNNRERKLMYSRFVEGKTAKEISDEFQISIDAYNKMQQRTYKKFYIWMERKAAISKINITDIFN